MKDTPSTTPSDPWGTSGLKRLAKQIKSWGMELGFQQIGIADTKLAETEKHLLHWLASGRHGEMDYMANHGLKRARPAELMPGTLRVISARMNYWPMTKPDSETLLKQDDRAFISRYALGRDYHKVMRERLRRLGEQIRQTVGRHHYRVFTDSAPVLEKALAEKAGLGWIGKHTNLIHRQQGSWFFIGEIYTDLPLPTDTPSSNHCGTCQACLEVCPTQAIVAPYQLDARRCISYLTIELRGRIPVEFRPLIGNRIFGCDDCQLICPWNRFARPTHEPNFRPRHGLDNADLVSLFRWDEAEFNKKTTGSAIRRTGYLGWLRNLAVALGNAKTSNSIITALNARSDHPSAMVREHINWALARHRVRTKTSE